MIGRALMLRYYLLCTGSRMLKDSIEHEDLIEYSAGYFPAGYNEFLNGIRYLLSGILQR